jgi:hypothetical protein
MFSKKRSKSKLRQSIALKEFYKKREHAKQTNKQTFNEKGAATDKDRF